MKIIDSFPPFQILLLSRKRVNLGTGRGRARYATAIASLVSAQINTLKSFHTDYLFLLAADLLPLQERPVFFTALCSHKPSLTKKGSAPSTILGCFSPQREGVGTVRGSDRFSVSLSFWFLLPALVSCAHAARNIHIINKIVC